MQPPFSLDVATGNIDVPALRLNVGPGLNFAEFEREHASEIGDRGANHPWRRCDLRKVEASWVVGVSLTFFADALKALKVGYGPVAASEWSNWSEARERAKAIEYDRDLTSLLGPAREFAWGTISAVYDDKAGGANIKIVYR